jgi:hypothetical protein
LRSWSVPQNFLYPQRDQPLLLPVDGLPSALGATGITNLWVSHLQFGALLTAVGRSADPCDLALFAMLGLLGSRIFEATGAVIVGLSDEHGAVVCCGVFGKAPRSS